IVLAKLDGSAKGGVIIPIAEQFGLPVKFIGVGEKLDDLEEFSPDEFASALFS
ncbi:MAG: signal recognition particle-docking protein FtsY, partial [Pirellula sp.]